MRNIVIVIMIISLLILSGCGSMQDTYNETKSTDLTGESLMGVHLFTKYDEKEFVSKYGKSRGDIKPIDPRFVDFDTYGIVMRVNKSNQILFVSVDLMGNKDKPFIKDFVTSRGITLGDTLADVKKKYGQNYYERDVEGSNPIIGYVDHQHHIVIEFWYDNSSGNDETSTIYSIRLGDSRREW